MPKNKKTRKKYNPAKAASRPMYHMFIDQRDLDGLKEIFTNVEMAVEYKLPKGVCTLEDVQMMRDVLNFGCVLCHASHVHDRALIAQEYGHTINATIDAFNTFYAKALEGCFTCNSSELNALRDGFEILGAVVRTSLTEETAWAFDCYRWMKGIADTEDSKCTVQCTGGRVCVDSTDIEKRIARFCSKTPPRRIVRDLICAQRKTGDQNAELG